jgi:hypothetical protein
MGWLDLLPASWVMGCTRQHIAPPWWQRAGGRCDVLWERATAERRDATKKNRRVHEADSWEHLGAKTLTTSLFVNLLWLQGIVERLWGPQALAAPGPWMVLAPLPDALDMGGACEGIAVVGLWLPAAWAVGVAGGAALGLRAVAWSPGAAWIGITDGCTGLTRALGAWTSPWPASPQGNARKIAAWREGNAGRSRRKQTGKKRMKSTLWGRRRNGLNDNCNWAV